MIRIIFTFMLVYPGVLFFPLATHAEECAAEDIEVVKAAAPAYPRRAKERGIEGFVELTFSIGTDGKPKEVTIVESQPQGVFDRAGTRAVLKTQFKPCMIDGQPAEVARVQLKYNFKI